MIRLMNKIIHAYTCVFENIYKLIYCYPGRTRLSGKEGEAIALPRWAGPGGRTAQETRGCGCSRCNVQSQYPRLAPHLAGQIKYDLFIFIWRGIVRKKDERSFSCLLADPCAHQMVSISGSSVQSGAKAQTATINLSPSTV